MNPSQLHVSKACQECRTRKVRCNGGQPCERCTRRGTHCAYRDKARNRLSTKRLRKFDGQAPTRLSDAQTPSDNAVISEHSAAPGINIHSVTATHRASPSCLHQLYYGPSSNFSLLYSLYHEIEGTKTNPSSLHGVEEVGPGLDLFSLRRLFFGDLADTKREAKRNLSESDPSFAFFLHPSTTRKYLERYLATYWHALPFIPKDEYRRKFDDLYQANTVFNFDTQDRVIMLLAMAHGAYMLGDDRSSDFLHQKAKQGTAMLDEVVNLQVVQIYLMMISNVLVAFGTWLIVVVRPFAIGEGPA